MQKNPAHTCDFNVIVYPHWNSRGYFLFCAALKHMFPQKTAPMRAQSANIFPTLASNTLLILQHETEHEKIPSWLRRRQQHHRQPPRPALVPGRLGHCVSTVHLWQRQLQQSWKAAIERRTNGEFQLKGSPALLQQVILAITVLPLQ